MAKRQPKKVRVRITASETVRYSQVREMTVAEYRELMKARKERPGRGPTSVVEGWIDRHDVFDSDGIDDDECEVELVKD